MGLDLLTILAGQGDIIEVDIFQQVGEGTECSLLKPVGGEGDQVKGHGSCLAGNQLVLFYKSPELPRPGVKLSFSVLPRSHY